MKTKVSTKEYFSNLGFKVGEGWKHNWSCYGPDAYALDWSAIKNDCWVSTGVVYDSVTQIVYEISVWDESVDKVYRWINPDYIQKVKREYKSRRLNFKIAYDLIKFEDLTATRILNKVKKI
jgi:hypothetical protein